MCLEGVSPSDGKEKPSSSGQLKKRSLYEDVVVTVDDFSLEDEVENLKDYKDP